MPQAATNLAVIEAADGRGDATGAGPAIATCRDAVAERGDACELARTADIVAARRQPMADRTLIKGGIVLTQDARWASCRGPTC